MRRAQMEKVPYMLILGDKEEAATTLSLRFRDGRQETLSLKDFKSLARKDIKARR
ncbi:MAG: His/Gly/Thr/Pro-type tRNA ligase C-terminal domain-containing protein [Chloroflexota bacterium]